MNAEDKILLSISELLDKKLDSIKGDISGLKSDVSELKDRVLKIEITQENKVIPSIRTLAEESNAQHDKLSEQIRSLSVIDELKNDVSVLKLAVRTLTDELARLKAAM